MERAARLWLSIPLMGLLACGGGYASTRHDELSGSAGSASSSAGRGGTSTAGTGSAGTSPVCACDPIDCGPGYVEVPNDDGCCFHCERSVDACELQTEAYVAYRDELIARYSSFGCMQASDCLVFYIQNRCDDSCQLTVTGARRAVIDGLNNYATVSCNDTCFPYPKPDCGVPPAAVCSNGRCEVVK
ncbi:MAG TPA: hypothetical protein VHP33_08400 [Polyangiaceae bacterium]|nr:hypothetical protein [Polyangiaceae bacterium]